MPVGGGQPGSSRWPQGERPGRAARAPPVPWLRACPPAGALGRWPQHRPRGLDEAAVVSPGPPARGRGRLRVRCAGAGGERGRVRSCVATGRGAHRRWTAWWRSHRRRPPAGDRIRLGVPGGEHGDRRVRALPQPTAHVQPSHPGQLQVQQHRIRPRASPPCTPPHDAGAPQEDRTGESAPSPPPRRERVHHRRAVHPGDSGVHHGFSSRTPHPPTVRRSARPPPPPRTHRCGSTPGDPHGVPQPGRPPMVRLGHSRPRSPAGAGPRPGMWAGTLVAEAAAAALGAQGGVGGI